MGHAAETCLLDPPIPFLKDPQQVRKLLLWVLVLAGLTCAYYLASKGHYCKVFDMQPQPGGMLRYGIPEYRLPKDVMDRELDHVWQLGVDLQYNVKLGTDFTIDDLFAQGFDAVYLAIGAWTSNPLVRLAKMQRVWSTLSRSWQKRLRVNLYLSRKDVRLLCLVVGLPRLTVRRTSLRLGAKVHTGYRRSIKEMTATIGRD